MSEIDLLHKLVKTDIPREQAAAAELTIEDVPEFLAQTAIPLLLEIAMQVYEVRSMAFAGFKHNEEMLDSHEERLQVVEEGDLGDSQLTPEDADLFNRICMALQGVAESITEQPNLPKEQIAMAAQLSQLSQAGIARIEEIAMSDDDDDDDDEPAAADEVPQNGAAAQPETQEG